jgi:hypothetical protein
MNNEKDFLTSKEEPYLRTGNQSTKLMEHEAQAFEKEGVPLLNFLTHELKDHTFFY